MIAPRSNNAILPISATGLTAVPGIPGGELHLVIDVTGYYRP